MSETTSNELVIRVTGEVVNLDDYRECAFRLDWVKEELLPEVQRVKRVLEDAIVAESVRSGVAALALGDGRKAVITRRSKVSYDGARLRQDLLEAGMPPERVAQIVEEVTTFKVHAVEAKKAARVNPDYGFAVEANRTEGEEQVYVDIKRLT